MNRLKKPDGTISCPLCYKITLLFADLVLPRAYGYGTWGETKPLIKSRNELTKAILNKESDADDEDEDLE